MEARRFKFLTPNIFLSLRWEEDLILIQLERRASIGFIWCHITLNTLKWEYVRLGRKCCLILLMFVLISLRSRLLTIETASFLISANPASILLLILLLCHLYEKVVIDVVIAIFALVIQWLLARDSITCCVIVCCKGGRTRAFTVHIRLLTPMDGGILSVEHQLT